MSAGFAVATSNLLVSCFSAVRHMEGLFLSHAKCQLLGGILTSFREAGDIVLLLPRLEKRKMAPGLLNPVPWSDI